MMEAFFQAHVLPEFKSPHGFLRYRVRCFSLFLSTSTLIRLFRPAKSSKSSSHAIWTGIGER